MTLKTNDPSRVVSDALSEGLRPDPILTVSEWAAKYRTLSPKASSEPGRWRNERTPYLVGIMDEMSAHSGTQEIVVKMGSQLGKTECLNNFIGYSVDCAPGPLMMIQPTLSMSKRNVKLRIDPLIADTPQIANKIAPSRSRDSSNTMEQKDFIDGTLIFTGANSASALASTPVKDVLMDEVDRYPGDVDNEGDPVMLAKARTKTFFNRKHVLTSTPTIAGSSRIETAYDESSKGEYQVPCPHCDHYQALIWKHVIFTKGDPSSAEYACEECGCLIAESNKTKMLAAGKWVHEEPDNPIKGFFLNSLYSPLGWYSWADAAKAWEDAHKLRGDEKVQRLKTFVNTVLGEVWQEQGEAPDWEVLYNRREEIPIDDTCPEGVVVITAGCDVQKDRLEMEVIGWGKNRENWSLEYNIIHGDTATEAPYKELAEFLDKQYAHPTGHHLPIQTMAIDSGYNTQHVYNFSRSYMPSKLMVIKGSESLQQMVGMGKNMDIRRDGRRITNGATLFNIGVGLIKSEVYSSLRQALPADWETTGFPRGWCHFPQYEMEYFKQLCAEQLVQKKKKGYNRYEWQKTRDRNEALDTRVYARAAASFIGIDRWTAETWDAKLMGLKDVPKPKEKQKTTKADSSKSGKKSYLNRRKGYLR